MAASAHVSGSGDWGNATIQTQGQWGNATLTNHGILGTLDVTTTGWNGGATVTTQGWSGGADLTGSATFNDVTIRGGINPNVSVDGTITIQNVLPYIDIAPWILASASTVLYTTGRSLELCGKNFEQPMVQKNRDYDLLSIVGDGGDDNDSFVARTTKSRERSQCCVIQ